MPAAAARLFAFLSIFLFWSSIFKQESQCKTNPHFRNDVCTMAQLADDRLHRRDFLSEGETYAGVCPALVCLPSSSFDLPSFYLPVWNCESFCFFSSRAICTHRQSDFSFFFSPLYPHCALLAAYLLILEAPYYCSIWMPVLLSVGSS